MLRLRFVLAAIAAVSLAGSGARGEEDMRIAPAYIQGLRDHGYFDLADEYLEHLRTDPDAPQELRSTIDYEQGRINIDEASTTGDLVLRDELLTKARKKLDAFTKAHPKNPLAPDAFVQLARLLVERGHLAMIASNDADTPKEKQAKLVLARRMFDDARDAYAQADTKLTAVFKTFPPFIPEGDPRKADRDRAHTSMMDAQLQKSVVDYEEGQTFPAGSKERDDFLTKGMTQFEDLYKRYRTQFAGLTARMWQAKCYEERGDFGPAMGIYNELMAHDDPRLRGLQRHVGYFQIILYNKRKEYPLAILGAQGWLRTYNTPAEQNSDQGLGVRLEAAKALLAQSQTEGVEPAEKAANKARAIDLLGYIVRFFSPHKAESLRLYKELKPKSASRFEDIARLNYEDAMGQAEQAIGEHEWEKAIPLLKQAIRKADPTRDPDKAILPRYNLAFCYYMNKQYYEANVLTEHLARRYPQKPLAPKATEIGMAALADAYNTYSQIDRASDLNRLINLANYTAETWPEKDEGDVARMTLGQIYHGMGQYPRAVAAYEAVKPKSSKWIEAQTKVGATHWELSQSRRRKGDAAAADEEVKKALASLDGALKARQEAGTVVTDPGLIGNVCDIADIELDTGKAAEALALLDPIAKAQTTPNGPVYSRLMADLLRAHITTGAVDLALGDMAALEKAGGGGNSLTQLYFSLGKLLEKEMEAQRAKGDGAALARIQAAYQKFLNALANAKAGQTYESLEWAGENMLTLQNPKEAAAVFKRIMETIGKDQAFLAQQGSGDRLLRTELKLSAALRGQKDFTAAEEIVNRLLKEQPRAIEPIIEQGMLLEAKAGAGQASWNAAYNHWRTLALRLATARPRPLEYYDAWYHAALALSKDGKGTLARQTLSSVMRLSPAVGGKEMKDKYAQLLTNLK